MKYTELQITSNFTFLRGGSHPEELVAQAIALGYTEIAITDRNSLAGIVRAYAAAKKTNLRIIPACRLVLRDGPDLLAYPTCREAYAQLSGLLTEGNLRAEKGECHLYKADVFRYAAGMKFIVLPPAALNEAFDFDPAFKAALLAYKQIFGGHLYLGATWSYKGDDTKRLYRISSLARQLHIPMVATNDVHYHHSERRQLQDVLTCIREKCTIYDAGFRLDQNAERYLKPADEMQRLFRQYPEAIRHTQEIAEACRFSLDALKYIYPEEITDGKHNPQQVLTRLTWDGAKEQFGNEIPKKIYDAILYELRFIKEKDYAPYFLTVHDIVRFARENNILCQGRGSAANSTVCYCLGITSVDPTKFHLLFERFVSSARDEPPDIDVDFEHERREEVIQYIYSKYGRDRAGIVATVTQVHGKGAIRDVGKAMGLSVDAVGRLSASLWEFTDEWLDDKRVTSEGFDANDPHLRKVLQLTREYIGFPRQLGQHTGGFVITRGKLSDLCPVLNARMENRTCIEWNKDDIDVLGFLKIDVLALGMLTCIRKAFNLVEAHYGDKLTLANIPPEDAKVYDMICEADTIGVFQIESRAQMSMLPRLKPREFYDLVIEVAIVRPGPIQGDMVHPYLRRRNGLETETYPKDELKEILERTKGVPLFQEQAMQIAITAAGFTPTEADELRRSMATFKAHGKVSNFRDKLVGGMVAKGYEEDFAKRVFRQLEGFGSYGFPESHAVSFALLVYVSSWLKCYRPEVFAAALLNSMPMGFYRPAQIIIDARGHGVAVRPVDVNHSCWDNTLEEKEGDYFSLRLGFRQVKGLRKEEMEQLTAARQAPFTSIVAVKNAGVPIDALERLADADAFRSLGLDRRRALWEVTALADLPEGIFTGASSEDPTEEGIRLPEMTLSEHVLQDYSTVTLSLKAHPVSFARQELFTRGILSTEELGNHGDGTLVRVAGLVLVRQRPGTASGICFITLEDETGIANVVVFQKIFEKYRKAIVRSRMLMVEGVLQVEEKVIHVIVHHCYDLTELLTPDTPEEEAASEGMIAMPVQEQKKQRKKVVQGTLFPARNFK